MKLIPLFEEVSEVSASEIVSTFKKSEVFKTLKTSISAIMKNFSSAFDEVVNKSFPETDDDNVKQEAFNDSFALLTNEYLY